MTVAYFPRLMDSHKEPNQLIRLWERGDLSQCELFARTWEHLWNFPEQKDDVLDTLSRHPDEGVREVVPQVQALLRRCAEQIKDIDHIRRTSPLQPGTRLLLRGGFEAGCSNGIPNAWWLNGRKFYKATFIRF